MGSTRRTRQRGYRATIVLTMPKEPETDAPLAPQELTPEDFYFDGEYLVFTAVYHLKRGFCCNSDCRHCPYK